MITLSLDAMGGDFGVETTLGGLVIFANTQKDVQFLVHGDKAVISEKLAAYPDIMKRVEIVHTEGVVPSDMKPSVALRQGRDTSMWNAIGSVLEGRADAIVSAGNTGALMAQSIARLKRVKGVRRPALAALWPTPKSLAVVLDVGANVSADETMLNDFALLGHAYAKSMLGKDTPSVGLLNVGSEAQKGGEDIANAAQVLAANPKLNYIGFVEGNSISEGVCDVVVTNGFTGNVTLKAAEGVAKLVGGYVRESLTQNLLTKLGALIASGGLKQAKERLDPANINAGVMLGLRGLVVKSHGGASAKGFSTSISVAYKIAQAGVLADIIAMFEAVAEPE